MPFLNFSEGVLENFLGCTPPCTPPRKSAPVPRPLLPSTSNDMIFFTQLSSSFHSTCPNHLSLLHCYCIWYNGKLVILCCMSRHHTEQVHIHQLKECDLLHSFHFLPIMARYCVPLARSGTI